MQLKEYSKYKNIKNKVFSFLKSQMLGKVISINCNFINEKNTKFYTVRIIFTIESDIKKEIVFKKVEKNFADEYIPEIIYEALDSFDISLS
jgi:type IV secretory pathway component VirB8